MGIKYCTVTRLSNACSSLKYMVVCLLGVGSIMAFNPAFAANQYYVIDINKQNTASFTSVHGLNNNSQVVGHGNQAFVWQNGGKQLITPDSFWSEAVAINDTGSVVGMAAQRREPGAWPGHAFVWRQNQGVQFLADGAALWSYARDINEAGQIVGFSSTGQSFLWEANGTANPLPGLGGASYAFAINDSASPMVVGSSKLATGQFRAFSWTQADGTTPLATINNQPNFATDVNDQGFVVGWIHTPGVNANNPGPVGGNWGWLIANFRSASGRINSPGDPFFSSYFEAFGQAVFWNATGQIQVIGVLPGFNYSMALGINNSGAMVGYSVDEADNHRAMLATVGGELVDINNIYPHPQGVIYEVATDINDAGHIIAWGRNPFSGENAQDFRPFLIIPANTGAVSNLAISSSFGGPQPQLNEVFSYGAMLSNNGPDENTNVSITFDIPDGLGLESTPNGCDFFAQKLTCKQATLSTTPPLQIQFNLKANAIGRHVIIVSATGDAIQDVHTTAALSTDIIVNNNVVMPQYRVTDITADLAAGDIDPSSMWFSQAYDINDQGDVSGRIGPVGFVWRNGVTDLSAIPCLPLNTGCGPVTNQWSEVTSINDLGRYTGIGGVQITGNGYFSEGSNFTPLDGLQSHGRAINNNNLVAGHAQEYGNYAQAFVWNTAADPAIPQNGQITWLGNLGGNNSYALAINDQDVVVGAAEQSSGKLRAYSWSAVKGMQALSLPVSGASVATGINNVQDVTGWYGESVMPTRVNWSTFQGLNPNAGPSAWFYGELVGHGNAFIQTRTQFHDLGPGMALDVNNSGIAVGTLRGPFNWVNEGVLPFPRETEYRGGFVYDTNQQILKYLDQLLPFDPDWRILSANAINNRGEIVGWGIYQGQMRAVLLQPIADADRDGIFDDVDNCTNVANADQYDSNGDGFGNICDADLNNDNVAVNPIDFIYFRNAYGLSAPDAGFNPDADFNHDNTVNPIDYIIFRNLYGLLPGPSGLAP